MVAQIRTALVRVPQAAGRSRLPGQRHMRPVVISSITSPGPGWSRSLLFRVNSHIHPENPG
jgi:hypothetical protein